MARLTWGDIGSRYYEAGVDRGVLFIDSGSGVAWHGLSSVSESPSGGEPRPFYYDGFKFLNLSSSEDFEASIEAYSAPPAFDKCDGRAEIANGLIATQQPRYPFDLTYRTLVGNDVDGHDHGYKIHLVYNALAKPSSTSHKTLSDSVDVGAKSWDITTRPPKMTAGKPTAHFVVDTRYAPAVLVAHLEGILYGTDDTTSRMPSLDEVLHIFTSYAQIELIERYDDAPMATVLYDAYVGTTPPALLPGEERIWLDTSGGDYAVLRYVTGE